ncbi:hypothetical protein A2U01_0032522, partial [Trifolium medium]|nr:hypothetical protein [Trifolium medium]
TNSSTDHGSEGTTAASVGSPSVPAGGGVAGHCRGVGGESGNYCTGDGYGGDYGNGYNGGFGGIGSLGPGGGDHNNSLRVNVNGQSSVQKAKILFLLY